MRLIDKNPPAQISKDVRIPVGKVFLLARRLVGVTQWVGDNPETENLQVGYLGASAGAGAAVIAAAEMRDKIGAIVSCGAVLEAANKMLPQVTCPTLLIVGGDDRRELI